jgi:hypothetical protein
VKKCTNSPLSDWRTIDCRIERRRKKRAGEKGKDIERGGDFWKQTSVLASPSRNNPFDRFAASNKF